MERAPVAIASVPKIESQDWLPGNPWSWLVLGLICCTTSWLLMALHGPAWPALRHGLTVAGMLAVVLAVQWSFTQSHLGQVSSLWRRVARFILAVLFLLLAGSVSLLLVVSFLWPDAAYPWRWGPVLVCWIVLAPLNASAGRQCLRRIRDNEALSGAEERALSLLLAGLACQAAVGALYDKSRPLELDSIRFFLGVATLMAIAAAPLVLVASTVRRSVVSLLIVLHFVGVTSFAVASFKGSIVIGQLTARISRPYLTFFFLGHPHAYFVEESPPSQLWFRIVFADDRAEWLKIPDGNDMPAQGNVNLTRYSCLIQLTAFASSPNLTGDFFRERLESANQTNLARGGMYVPFLNESEVPVSQQFLIPTAGVFGVLKSYVLHVVHEAEQTGRRVRNIKVYRAKHRILSIQEYLKGIKEPWDPDTFQTVYMGDFDAQGDQINPALPVFLTSTASTVGLMCSPLDDGPWLAAAAVFSSSSAFCPGKTWNDPLLYWMLPTVREGSMRAPTFRCYVRKHAGDPAWIRNARGQWVEDEPTP